MIWGYPPFRRPPSEHLNNIFQTDSTVDGQYSFVYWLYQGFQTIFNKSTNAGSGKSHRFQYSKMVYIVYIMTWMIWGWPHDLGNLPIATRLPGLQAVHFL